MFVITNYTWCISATYHGTEGFKGDTLLGAYCTQGFKGDILLGVYCTESRNNKRIDNKSSRMPPAAILGTRRLLLGFF